MPFPMKIQPIGLNFLEDPTRHESTKPVVKSRLKRLFERQFVRISTAEKIAGAEEVGHCKNDFEPSSVCLANMVQSFIEDEDKQTATVRCSRNRCNCFNGNCSDSTDDELDSFGDACETLKVYFWSNEFKITDIVFCFYISECFVVEFSVLRKIPVY